MQFDDLDTHFTLHAGYALDGEEFSPAEHILGLSGRLFYRDDNDVETNVGGMEGGLVNIGRLMNERVDIAEVMDAESQEEYECYSALFSERAWRDVILDEIEGYPFGLLIINRITIEPEYRRNGLGVRLLERLLASTFIPSGTIVTLKPHALGHDDDQSAFDAGTAKLAAYWSKAGLRPVPYNGFGYYYTYIE